jgi:hypothetical protein
MNKKGDQSLPLIVKLIILLILLIAVGALFLALSNKGEGLLGGLLNLF